MQAIAAFMTTVGTKVAAVAGTGLTGLSGAATGLSMIGTVVGGIAQYQSAKAQSEAARYAAEVEEQNAKRAIFASQVQAQDVDFENAEAMGATEAAQGASGLSLSSGSFMRRRNRNRVKAATARARIRNEGEIQAASYLNQANMYRMEASAANSKANFSLLAIPFNLAQDQISGASLVNRDTATRITTQRIAV